MEHSFDHDKQESGKSGNYEGVTIKFIKTENPDLNFTEKLVKDNTEKRKTNLAFHIDFSLTSYQTPNWDDPLLKGFVNYEMRSVPANKN